MGANIAGEAFVKAKPWPYLGRLIDGILQSQAPIAI